MSQTNKKKLDQCREAFDYMVKMSMEKIEKGGQVISEFSAIVFLPDDETLSIIPVPMNDTVDAEQRREVMRLAGEDLADQQADAYVFMAIAEAWASSAKGSKTVRPHNDPKRKEIFLASAQDKNGYVRNISYQIKRKGKEVTFARINMFGKSQAKFLYKWEKQEDVKIENSLTKEAWDHYKNKVKELTI